MLMETSLPEICVYDILLEPINVTASKTCTIEWIYIACDTLGQKRKNARGNVRSYATIPA